MKIRRVSYFALAAFVFAASCAKEAAEPNVFDWEDGSIYIKPSISVVGGSRAQDMTLEHLESFQVTCFNTADKYTDSEGFLSPYFENATFVRKTYTPTLNSYASSPDEDPRCWPSNEGMMRFFAFYPSPAVMAGGNAAIEGDTVNVYFSLINRTVGDGTTASVDYRLSNFRINPEISRQFDFITAEAAGERWIDFRSGVDLPFSHQLCQVDLKAWGDGSIHDFEIAGVRLGNPVVEGDFIFAHDSAPATAGSWATSNESVKDKVDYIYRKAGDRIFKINNKEHNSADSAASIMGSGGCAMVIPTVNTRWEGLEDPDITSTPYKTEKMYFGILMRVTDHESGNVIYPYPDEQTGMTVISYAIDKEGNILDQVYAGNDSVAYYADPELLLPYEASDGVEIRDFGWAAVPVDADWSAGKRYVYTLDYSEGIGLHIPEDPEPGKPISGKSAVMWGVGVESWSDAAKDENYEPDLEVPFE